MPATARTSRPHAPTTSNPTRHAPRRTKKLLLPTPRRFLHCIACGTIKKERSYALCSECYKRNGRLERGWFTRLARKSDREAPQYSYRVHPEFDKACRIYARRRQRTKATAAIDTFIARHEPRETDSRATCTPEEYDGLAGHDVGDLLDWQRYGMTLPELEGCRHREATEAEVARWDAQIDAWAKARGFSMADEAAPEIRPWGYWMEVDGAMVWTDDID